MPTQWQSRKSRSFFFPVQQALLQATAKLLAVTLLQHPVDVVKEVVAKDGINKLKLFHFCGVINPESTSFDTLTFATFSKGMDLVVSQPWAGRDGALSDLLSQTLATAREEDTFNIRSIAVSLKHISKSTTAHMMSGNFATEEAASLACHQPFCGHSSEEPSLGE
jgi:hypothetical protein